MAPSKLADRSKQRRSVAFLRGINVGGHRVTKDELIAVFADIGHTRVDTFLASGNVLFQPTTTPQTAEAVADIEATIAAALEQALGYAVPTTLRTPAQMVVLATSAPFSDEQLAASDGKPQVMLLFAEPTSEAEKQVLALSTADDQLAFGPRALHWLPSGGMADSTLDLKAIGDVLGQQTIRTVNTVRRLLPKL